MEIVLAVALFGLLVVLIGIRLELRQIGSDPDPFMRFMKHKAFLFGLTSFYPPLWWSRERRQEALRPYMEEWVAEYQEQLKQK